MDCRHARQALKSGPGTCSSCWLSAAWSRLGSWSVSLGFLLGTAAGCVHQQTTPIQPPEPAVTQKIEKPDEGPQRLPKASTCAAFGTFNLKAYAQPDRTPIQKQQLLDQARRAFQQAIKEDPKLVDAYQGLAQAYQEMGDQDRAEATYESALKISPKDAPLRFALGMSQARAKRWDLAISNMDQACQLEPENRAYTDMLAYTLARAGRFDDSFAVFKKTVGDAQAHYNLARMYHHLKNDTACLEELCLALAANPDHKDARIFLNQLKHPADAQSQPIVAVGFETLDETPSKADSNSADHKAGTIASPH
jgi:tetratricopeptide (TPR) repeat protein